MAKTLTTSWQTISSYTVYPSGYELTFYVDARYTSQSVSKNNTKVETRLRSVHSGGVYSSDYHTFGCTYASNVDYHGKWTYETETITSGSSTVSHNDDGTKTIRIQGSVYDSAWGWNNTFGDNVILPTIPRYAEFTTQPFLSNSTEHILDIFYKPDRALVGAQYAIKKTSDSDYGAWTSLDVISGTWNTTEGATFRISNLDADTSYNIKMRIQGYSGGPWRESNIVTATTLSNAVTINVNGTWKKATPYINVNGTWKKARPYINVNDTWKEGIN